MSSLDYAVVIPTRGRRQLVHETLRSVVDQTLPPSQVIVVVDGDVDGTAHAVRAAYPDVEVLVHDTQRGAAAARNTGIRRATAEWVCFVDNDDLWHRDKQRRFAAALQDHPDWAAVRSYFWYFSERADGPQTGFGMRRELVGADLDALEAAASTAAPRNDLSYLDIAGRSLELMLERNRGAMSTTMVRRDILERAAKVPDDLTRANDWLLFVHVAAVTEWQLIAERLAFCRFHSGQLTRVDLTGPSAIVRARLLAWQRYGSIAPKPLATYGREYRAEVRRFAWSLVASGHGVAAWRLFRQARPLLP